MRKNKTCALRSDANNPLLFFSVASETYFRIFVPRVLLSCWKNVFYFSWKCTRVSVHTLPTRNPIHNLTYDLDTPVQQLPHALRAEISAGNKSRVQNFVNTSRFKCSGGYRRVNARYSPPIAIPLSIIPRRFVLYNTSPRALSVFPRAHVSNVATLNIDI